MPEKTYAESREKCFITSSGEVNSGAYVAHYVTHQVTNEGKTWTKLSDWCKDLKKKGYQFSTN